MAGLSEHDRAIVKEALNLWRRKNTFETALSRAVKSQGGSFEDYIRLISDLRDAARRGGVEIHEAARQLIEPEK